MAQAPRLRKFYDPVTRKLIGKPENYLGVAARIAATSHELGLGPDRAALDALLDRAAEPFADGRLYADDDPPHGRFDRYSNEYARYVFEAAGIAGRKDIQERLRPSHPPADAALLGPRRAGRVRVPVGPQPGGRQLPRQRRDRRVPGGRARPAPRAASRTWPPPSPRPGARCARTTATTRTCCRSSRPAAATTRTSPASASGSRRRGSSASSRRRRRASSARSSARGSRPSPTRCRRRRSRATRRSRQGERPAGVWVVRRGRLRFAVPFTTGPKPGFADYLPAPQGLPGFAAPVEHVAPGARDVPRPRRRADARRRRRGGRDRRRRERPRRHRALDALGGRGRALRDARGRRA